jgi:hypothetical protein
VSERNQRQDPSLLGRDPGRERLREAYRQEMNRVRAATIQGTQEVAREDLAQKLGAAVYYAGCLTAGLVEVVRHGDALVDAVQAAEGQVPEGLCRPLAGMLETLADLCIEASILEDLAQEAGVVIVTVGDEPEGEAPAAMVNPFVGVIGEAG